MFLHFHGQLRGSTIVALGSRPPGVRPPSNSFSSTMKIWPLPDRKGGLMRPKTFSIRLAATLAIFALTLLATNTCAAAEKVLHAFSESVKDGNTTFRGWAADATGNLYGTTREGGAHGSG